MCGKIYYQNEKLHSIESGLEELSIQMIGIFDRYQNKGIINEDQYKKFVKKKREFLKHLDDRRKNIINCT
ncbi:MAG: hypothetical protein GX214_08740 [Clostridiales bacterium]|nr:hypothetical protein [Clostridiales bacterium]